MSTDVCQWLYECPAQNLCADPVSLAFDIDLQTMMPTAWLPNRCRSATFIPKGLDLWHTVLSVR